MQNSFLKLYKGSYKILLQQYYPASLLIRMDIMPKQAHCMTCLVPRFLPVAFGSWVLNFDNASLAPAVSFLLPQPPPPARATVRQGLIPSSLLGFVVCPEMGKKASVAEYTVIRDEEKTKYCCYLQSTVGNWRSHCLEFC